VKIFSITGAVAWKTLSGAERHPYEQMAKKDSAKFHRKLQQYKVGYF